jgi:hypothetical protein
MAAFLFVEQHQRRPRVFRDRLNPNSYNDDELRRKYRLTRDAITDLCDSLDASIAPKTNRNHAVSTNLQVLTALRYYATGSFQELLGDSHGLSKATLSRIILRVTNAIVRTHSGKISFPRTAAERTDCKQGFYNVAGFPNVLGCVDGTLIPIKTPHDDEHLYVSRKGGHALNVQVVCDSGLRFTNAVVRYPGSTHDSFIWNNCSLNEKFSTGQITDGWLLGDSGYDFAAY